MYLDQTFQYTIEFKTAVNFLYVPNTVLCIWTKQFNFYVI